jgi:hypothetical protein
MLSVALGPRRILTTNLTASNLWLGIPDVPFDGTLPILRSVFRVLPGYMAVHKFVPLFRNLRITLANRSKFFFYACFPEFCTSNLPWYVIFIIIIVIIIISGSAVLVRTLAALHRRFRNLRHTVGLLWTIDQPIAKASTGTGQHRNTKTNIHASSGFRTHDPGDQAAKPLDRAVTGTGYMRYCRTINVI